MKSRLALRLCVRHDKRRYSRHETNVHEREEMMNITVIRSMLMPKKEGKE